MSNLALIAIRWVTMKPRPSSTAELAGRDPVGMKVMRRQENFRRLLEVLEELGFLQDDPPKHWSIEDFVCCIKTYEQARKVKIKTVSDVRKHPELEWVCFYLRNHRKKCVRPISCALSGKNPIYGYSRRERQENPVLWENCISALEKARGKPFASATEFKKEHNNMYWLAYWDRLLPIIGTSRGWIIAVSRENQEDVFVAMRRLARTFLTAYRTQKNSQATLDDVFTFGNRNLGLTRYLNGRLTCYRQVLYVATDIMTVNDISPAHIKRLTSWHVGQVSYFLAILGIQKKDDIQRYKGLADLCCRIPTLNDAMGFEDRTIVVGIERRLENHVLDVYALLNHIQKQNHYDKFQKHYDVAVEAVNKLRYLLDVAAWFLRIPLCYDQKKSACDLLSDAEKILADRRERAVRHSGMRGLKLPLATWLVAFNRHDLIREITPKQASTARVYKKTKVNWACKYTGKTYQASVASRMDGKGCNFPNRAFPASCPHCRKTFA